MHGPYDAEVWAIDAAIIASTVAGSFEGRRPIEEQNDGKIRIARYAPAASRIHACMS